MIPPRGILSKTIALRTEGFVYSQGFPKLLLLKDPTPEECALVVKMGNLRDILGPTILFSSAQVARGDFDKFMITIENQAGKGVLPRLRNNGKAEK